MEKVMMKKAGHGTITTGLPRFYAFGVQGCSEQGCSEALAAW